jgi:DNA-binding NarL/FixJ family response regulator
MEVACMSRRASRPPAVLLLDGEPEFLVTLHQVLISVVATYEVLTVHHSTDVLVQVARRTVPLAILFDRPDVNPLQLIIDIKRVSTHTHVVLVTSRALEERARALGADDYLPASIAPERLEQIVRAALA